MPLEPSCAENFVLNRLRVLLLGWIYLPATSCVTWKNSIERDVGLREKKIRQLLGEKAPRNPSLNEEECTVEIVDLNAWEPEKNKASLLTSRLFLLHKNILIFFKFFQFYASIIVEWEVKQMTRFSQTDFISQAPPFKSHEETTRRRSQDPDRIARGRICLGFRTTKNDSRRVAPRLTIVYAAFHSFIHSFVRRENSWAWIGLIHAPGATERRIMWMLASVTTTRKCATHFQKIKYYSQTRFRRLQVVMI